MPRKPMERIKRDDFHSLINAIQNPRNEGFGYQVKIKIPFVGKMRYVITWRGQKTGTYLYDTRNEEFLYDPRVSQSPDKYESVLDIREGVLKKAEDKEKWHQAVDNFHERNELLGRHEMFRSEVDLVEIRVPIKYEVDKALSAIEKAGYKLCGQETVRNDRHELVGHVIYIGGEPSFKLNPDIGEETVTEITEILKGHRTPRKRKFSFDNVKAVKKKKRL